jgi:DNA end-binding protein Ku
MKMAVELINQLSGGFDLSGYKDTYSEALMRLIHAKAKGRRPSPPPLRVVHNAGKDLMSQLKASLQGRKRKVS